MKSITFRCTEEQNQRLLAALQQSHCTRTTLITNALECFLSYTEQEHIQAKDLFGLVEDIDASGQGPAFAEQA